jgi:hypothetical protein
VSSRLGLLSTVWFAVSLLVALAAAVAWALLDGPGHPLYVLEAVFLALGLVLVYLVAAGRLGRR